jgi:curli biogenesis system outer membrane secretion channel CsgG
MVLQASARAKLFSAAVALGIPFLLGSPALSLEPAAASGSSEAVTPVKRPSILDSSPSILSRKPVVIAVRKVKNLAGRYAEEGRDADNNMIGFWKPSYEIRLAEILSTELANTGNFTIVERENLYEALAEQNMAGLNQKTAVKKNNFTQANYIVIASLSDYIPNTAGKRKNQAGRVAFITFANDREQVDTYIAFDLRVINTSTGSIAYSRTVEGISSSVKKSDTLGLNFNAFFGAGGGSGTKVTEEATPATRAIRAAMVNIVDYLNCHLYVKDQCIAEFEAADAKRRESTKGTLNLF